jgi:ABC-type iron transport system FetAB permease component
MSLFLIGIVEMIIISMWTRFVSESKIMASGVTSVVNIFIWYYVLQAVIDDIENINLVALYAAGCAAGTMITTAYFRYAHKRTSSEDPSECANEHYA